MVRKVTLSVKIQAKVNFEGMGAKPQYDSKFLYLRSIINNVLRPLGWVLCNTDICQIRYSGLKQFYRTANY